MKGAKIGGRQRGDTTVVEENVAIEYLEMTSADAADQHWMQTELLRTNHGVVEAASKGAQGLIGMDRAALEQHIVQGEETGLDIDIRSLVGINYMRISYPQLDAQLVLPKKEVSTD